MVLEVVGKLWWDAHGALGGVKPDVAVLAHLVCGVSTTAWC